jgi:hypothetical protein
MLLGWRLSGLTASARADNSSTKSPFRATVTTTKRSFSPMSPPSRTPPAGISFLGFVGDETPTANRQGRSTLLSASKI